MGKPIRRVEVKVARRSNVPRWDRRASPMNDGDSPVVGVSYGGGGMETGDGDPSMDFSKLKETLPQFQESPKIAVDSSEQTPSMGVSTKISVDKSENAGINKEHISHVRDFSQKDILIANDTCVSQSMPTEKKLNVDSYEVVVDKESEGANHGICLKEVSRGTEKENLSTSRKKKGNGNQYHGSVRKENISSSLDLNAMHDMVVQGESRGVWK